MTMTGLIYTYQVRMEWRCKGVGQQYERSRQRDIPGRHRAWEPDGMGIGLEEWRLFIFREEIGCSS